MTTVLNVTEPTFHSQAAMDYERIEKAIGYLESHFRDQPDLATVARAAHVSEFHFQRLFSRWAGISPKRFLQFLTVEFAKEQLAASKGVLDATLDSGLSSPGRLHDLFVSIEAVTPGEFKSRGTGLQISYGFQPTPFGECLVGVTTRGICWLSFLSDSNRRAALREMQTHWRGAEVAERTEATEQVATKIFCGFAKRNPDSSGLSVLLMGTNFQIKVWQALLRIPPGKIVSYETVGQIIGAENSSRAIGAAIGQNSIAYLIPCHRVIRKSGLLGGYRWGEPRKRAMLAWESTRSAMSGAACQ